MLTIREKLPVKRLVLYGSTAILVGFAGTYTVLRELFPYDQRDNLADVSSRARQTASGNVIKPATDTADKDATDASTDALQDSGMVVSESPSAAQQQPAKAAAPAAPSSNSGPITATPSTPPAPTVVEPADTTPMPQPEVQPALTPPPVVEPPVSPVAPLPENTTDGVINIQINKP
jgi:hypothetical protein